MRPSARSCSIARTVSSSTKSRWSFSPSSVDETDVELFHTGGQVHVFDPAQRHDRVHFLGQLPQGGDATDPHLVVVGMPDGFAGLGEPAVGVVERVGPAVANDLGGQLRPGRGWSDRASPATPTASARAPPMRRTRRRAGRPRSPRRCRCRGRRAPPPPAPAAGDRHGTPPMRDPPPGRACSRSMTKRPAARRPPSRSWRRKPTARDASASSSRDAHRSRRSMSMWPRPIRTSSFPVRMAWRIAVHHSTQASTASGSWCVSSLTARAASASAASSSR